MNYDEYTYLYPPRPEKAIPRDLLVFYQNRGYWAQVKKNGTCTVIFAKGDEVIFKTRHHDDHKQWTPLPEHYDFFKGGDKWNVFVGELIHSKTTHIKNQLYLFDQIVDDGFHLIDMTFEERQLLLQSRWVGEQESDQTRISPFVSIAHNFSSNFDSLFNTLKPEDEGLVLKNPSSRLKACFKQSANAGWQVKCRIPTKNYSF